MVLVIWEFDPVCDTVTCFYNLACDVGILGHCFPCRVINSILVLFNAVELMELPICIQEGFSLELTFGLKSALNGCTARVTLFDGYLLVPELFRQPVNAKIPWD